ncbi:MAG: putative ATPase [Ramlibacter sp.]|nr:putative ATPase [Ramlibacter sp.]
MDAMPVPFRSLSFGPYAVYPLERVLSRGGRPVKVGSRAFDLLLALLSRPGEVVAAAELIARVWPRRVVEDSSLRVQLGLLRRALGDGIQGARYIATLSGRGYSFVAPVAFESPGPPLNVIAVGRGPRERQPAPDAHLVGREADLAEIVWRCSRHALVVLTGPSGVGKSVLALAVATRLQPLFTDGFQLVDLARAADCRHVRAMVEAAISLANRGMSSGAKHLLLVLDNCDAHVGCVSALLRSLREERPEVHILTTVREQPGPAGPELRDACLAIAPLPYPDPAHQWTPAEALSFPAVQLFVQEAMTCLPSFLFDGANVGLVVEACARVQGSPLAIKLATAWTEHLALNTIVGLLDACLLQNLAVNGGRAGGCSCEVPAGAMDGPVHRAHAPVRWLTGAVA